MFYDCGALAREARSNANRQREIEALMIKAKSGAGGRFVSSAVYRPEYLQLRGMMEQICKTAAEKNCNLSGGGSGPAKAMPKFRGGTRLRRKIRLAVCHFRNVGRSCACYLITGTTG